jgi:hypothetical protein
MNGSTQRGTALKLEKQLNRRLKIMFGVEGVTAKVEQGVVHLQGIVQDKEVHQRILQTVWCYPEVESVTDDILVECPEGDQLALRL